MNSFLRTGLYRLHDPNMDWGAAHLYEHLLIQSFHDVVVANGYSPYLYGWVGGETFEGVMFIEYGFYNPDIEKLFVKFIQQTPRVDLAMLKNEILRAEAEDMVLIDVSDFEQLTLRLESMDKAKFIDVETDSDIEQINSISGAQSVIREKRSKKSFRQVTVAVGLPSGSLEDKVLFTRLTPIIFDAINARLFNEGMYQNEVSWPVYNRPHDAMLSHAIYTVKKSTATNKDVRLAAEEALAGVQIKNHEKELEYYIQGFMITPNWHTFPIDYFRYAGLFASRKRIGQLFTPENVERVISNLKVDVVHTVPDHFSVAK